MSHSILSPSSAYRWTSCTMSAKTIAAIKKTLNAESVSKYAEEGTRLHELAYKQAEAYFNKKADYKPSNNAIVNKYIAALMRFSLELDSDKIQTVFEQRVVIDERTNTEGTADAIFTDGKTLHIIDLKTGSGIKVFAKNNLQLVLYAIGVFNTAEKQGKKFKLLQAITAKAIKFSIIQPSLDHVDTWEIDRGTLEHLNKHLAEYIDVAYKGEGDYLPSVTNCQFCEAKAMCPAFNTNGQEMFKKFFDTLKTGQTRTLTNAELAFIMANAEQVNKFINEVKQLSYTALMNGETIDGLKLVKGRAIRKVTDESALVEKFKSINIPEALLYNKKLITLTELQTLAGGKKKFEALVGDTVQKIEGNPQIVTTDDPREEYQPAAAMFSEV